MSLSDDSAPGAAAPTPGPPGRVGERAKRDGVVQIHVAGTSEEMGAQHGELLRVEVRDLISALHHHVLDGQRSLFGWAVRNALPAVARLMEARIPARYLREMKSLARAADVAYRDILLLNCLDDVFANLWVPGSLLARLACSAFALWGARSATGELLAGRNLDYFIFSAAGDDPWAATTYMKEHVVAVQYEPGGLHPFASVGWPGFIGAATAMNAPGLLLSSLTVPVYANWPIATPATFVYRRVVEECESLSQAVKLVRTARRTQGNNVLLASGPEQTARVVEYTPWRLEVREPEGDAIGVTNHFVHPAMVRAQAKIILFSSQERLARLGDLCVGPVADPQAAGEVLLDREVRRPEANEFCTIQNPYTIYSAVFAPTHGRLWVRATDSPERPFQEVEVP